MLVEFSIIPIGSGSHISAEVASAVRIVEESGLPFQLTPSSTIVEGEWDEVMAVLRRCHHAVREMSPHLVTVIKIEDEAGADRKLVHNVASVEEKLQHAGTAEE